MLTKIYSTAQNYKNKQNFLVLAAFVQFFCSFHMKLFMNTYAFECALSEYLVRNLIHSLISIETSIETNK